MIMALKGSKSVVVQWVAKYHGPVGNWGMKTPSIEINKYDGLTPVEPAAPPALTFPFK